MAYITCNGVDIGYEGQVVTGDIRFEVNKGDYLCIVGENGAGKSTLMKTLLHLIKPLSGKIEYADGLEEQEIGYLPQHTVIQRDFPADVWEIVLSGNLSSIGRRPFYQEEEKKKTRQMLEKMGIWNLRNKSYRDLSGGQQQRVLLARALCATNKLLILDEPVTGLDPVVTAEFYQLIRDLNAEGVTIIMVSHDVHTAVAEASMILHIGRKGQLFFGTKEEYLESEAYHLFAAVEESQS